MKEFAIHALPFVIIGVCVAILAVNVGAFRKKDKRENYMALGMCFGMCLGVTVSSVFELNMGLSITLGMLVGETVGCLIPKNADKK